MLRFSPNAKPSCLPLNQWPSDEAQHPLAHHGTNISYDRSKQFTTQAVVTGFEYRNPQGAQLIRHRFQVKVWELNWDLDLAKVATVEKWPATFDRLREWRLASRQARKRRLQPATARYLRRDDGLGVSLQQVRHYP